MRACSFRTSCRKKNIFFLCSTLLCFFSFHNRMIVFFMDVKRSNEHDYFSSLFTFSNYISLVWLCSLSKCSSSWICSKKKGTNDSSRCTHYSLSHYSLFPYIKSYLVCIMYKFLSLFLLSFVLVGCSLPGVETEKNISGASVYSTGTFSVSYPSAWTEVAATSLPNPYYGKIAFARVSPEVKYGFSQNMLILESELNIPVTSFKYSEQNARETSKNYLEYSKISGDAIVFSDGDSAILHVFEARYNTTTARMKFLQTAKVCGTKVYLLHITLGLDKDPLKYKELFTTFSCK